MNYAYELFKNNDNNYYFYNTKLIESPNNIKPIDPIKWINYRYDTYLQIVKEQDNIEKLDNYLTIYNFDKLFLITDKNEAINNLYSFKHGIYEIIINNFKKSNIDIFIGGSSVLASITKDDYKFEANDMDIYIKNIDNSKIIEIDDVIQKTFCKDNYKIYIVKRPITITWWIFNLDEELIFLIQLNSLLIKSWTEIFTVYHSDLLCIGYEILTNNFVTLNYRWNSIKTFDDPIYFTNIFNLDNIDQLLNAVNKYGNRNFKTVLVTENPKIVNIKNTQFSGSMNNKIVNVSGTCNEILKCNIINTFKIYYENCHDIVIDKNICNLINVNIYITRLINIKRLFEINTTLFNKHDELNNNGSFTCPISLENVNILIKNNKCSHGISLYVYLKHRIDKCPLCRKEWVIEDCYIEN